MSRTPPNGAPSTPRLPSARLVIPSGIRPSRSLSTLHIQSPSQVLEVPGPAPLPLDPSHSVALDSTASSLINMDLNDGILVQDVEVETEDAEDISVMTLNSDRAKIDEASKKSLRDQLRKTLSRKPSGPGGVYQVLPDSHSWPYFKRPQDLLLV